MNLSSDILSYTCELTLLLGGVWSSDRPATEIFSLILCLNNKQKQNKTFNNGSLGSGIDEERSEMRKVM